MQTPFECDYDVDNMGDELFGFRAFIFNDSQKVLMVELLSKNGQVEVKRIKQGKSENWAELRKQNKYVWEGPKFDSLNPKLQDDFVKYLDSLGVDSETVKLVRYIGLNKENRDLIKWMMRISELAKV